MDQSKRDGGLPNEPEMHVVETFTPPSAVVAGLDERMRGERGARLRMLRDEFAMAALPAVLADALQHTAPQPNIVADVCYKVADAMLKAREPKASNALDDSIPTPPRERPPYVPVHGCACRQCEASREVSARALPVTETPDPHYADVPPPAPLHRGATAVPLHRHCFDALTHRCIYCGVSDVSIETGPLPH